jgi:plasmid maintenance system antidote protein VapI
MNTWLPIKLGKALGLKKGMLENLQVYYDIEQTKISQTLDIITVNDLTKVNVVRSLLPLISDSMQLCC